MRTTKSNSKWFHNVRMTDFEIPLSKIKEFRSKVSKILKDEYFNHHWVGHAHSDFVYYLNSVLCTKKKLSLNKLVDLFGDNVDVFRHIWLVFKREFHFKKENSCIVHMYNYHDEPSCDKYIIPIQSLVREITNSSSELFTVISDDVEKHLLELLEGARNPNEGCSGEGGTLEVYKVSAVQQLWHIYNRPYFFSDNPDKCEKIVRKDFTQDELDVIDNIIKKNYNTTQNVYKVRVDYGFKSVQDFVVNNLNGIKIE